MTKIICMASAKGGSGKTVLTATFAAFLSNLGKRVLMIDTDAATNGLTLLYLKEVLLQSEIAIAAGRVPKGVYEGDGILSPEIVSLPTGADIIPATYAFTNPEHVSLDVFVASLDRTIALARKQYDYIFLDAQAGADEFAQIAMSRHRSDEVVIVSEYDPLSAAGVERLKGLLREDLTYVRTWVLLNKVLPEFVQSFSDFMEVAKYASPIPWDADVVRAYARRRLALDLERGNEFTLAIVQTLRSILGDDIGRELSDWLETRAAALREPIETQYGDAERELEALIRERKFLEYEAKRRSAIFDMGLAVASLVVAIGVLVPIEAIAPVGKIIALALSGMLIFGAAFIRIKRRTPSVDTDVREARFKRQEDILQDRLKKLEALRRADVETLLRGQRGSL